MVEWRVGMARCVHAAGSCTRPRAPHHTRAHLEQVAHHHRVGHHDESLGPKLELEHAAALDEPAGVGGVGGSGRSASVPSVRLQSLNTARTLLLPPPCPCTSPLAPAPPFVERLEQRLVARQVRELACGHGDGLAAHIELEVALQCSGSSIQAAARHAHGAESGLGAACGVCKPPPTAQPRKLHKR